MKVALGLDFGTSNCSACIATQLAILSVELENDEPLLPSVVFTGRGEVAKKQIGNNEFLKRLNKAQNEVAQLQKKQRADGQQQTMIDKDALKKIVVESLEREAAVDAENAYWDQTFFSMLKDGNAMLFGSPALRAYMDDPLAGVLVRSPKSFLGSAISSEHLKNFEQVVVEIIKHIKRKADTKAGLNIENVVIGRPVKYYGSTNDMGNKQALKIMQSASISAGFKNVEFVLEPVAAAFEYERTLQTEETVLVVDIGGGTTDCAVVRVGPKRAMRTTRLDDLLGYAGDRIGGTDFDQLLAWNSFMPLLGKGTTFKEGIPIPHGILFDGISTRDVPAQIRFNNAKHDIQKIVERAEQPEKLLRLLKLQTGSLQHRLINSAELAKIFLSQQAKCTVPLNYIEQGLTSSLSQEDFKSLSKRLLIKIRKLAEEAVIAAGIKPSTVFITGGMGISPIVQDALKSILGNNINYVYGDMLSSVGRGLALHAQKSF